MASPVIASPVGGAVSPCDGHVRRVSVDQTFSAIVAGSGNSGNLASNTTNNSPFVKASTTSDQFAELVRCGFNFDTSAIPDDATIDSATLSLWFTAKTNGLGADSYTVVGFTPASTGAIPDTAFTRFGSTAYSSPLTYASITTGAWNDISLNTDGKGAINKSGITSIGLRSEWDRSGTFSGVWASGASSTATFEFADASHPPKLTVAYTEAATGTRRQVTLTGAGA